MKRIKVVIDADDDDSLDLNRIHCHPHKKHILEKL